MNQYQFLKSALTHNISSLSERWAGSSVRIVVVLGIIALPYIFPLPFFSSLAVNLGQSFISTIGYKIEFTRPSPDSDYVISQSSTDYEAYVQRYADLHSSYQNDSTDLYWRPGFKASDLSISDWGRAHYIEYGKSEGRFTPILDSTSSVVRKRTQSFPTTSSITFRVHTDSRRIRIDNDSDEQQIGFGQICFSAFYNFSVFYNSFSALYNSLCWEQEQKEVGRRNHTLVNHNFGLRIKNAYSLNDLSLSVPDQQVDLTFTRQGGDPYLILSSQVVTISKDHLFQRLNTSFQRLSTSLLLILWSIAILFISFLIISCYKRLLRRHPTHKGYKSISKHVPICILIVFCMVVGVRGIDYGDHFDEGGYIDTTKRMLEQVGSGGSLLPHWYGFPSLIFYLSLLPVAPEAIIDQVSATLNISSQSDSALSKLADQRIAAGGLTRYQYILKTRYISLLFYGVSIFLIYLIVLRMSGNWREAFTASALFSLSWEAAYHFRMFTPDPIMVPFVLLTLYFLVSARYRSDWNRHLRWASICAGIACGAKYTAVFLTLSIFFSSLYLHFQSKYQIYIQQTQEAAFLNSRYRSTQVHSELGVRSFLALGLRLVSWFLLAYLLTTPGTILEPIKFLNDIAAQEWTYRVSGGGGYSVWLLYDKLQIMGTYFGAVVFSHYFWVAIISSAFLLIGIYQVTQKAFVTVVFFPFLVATLVVLLNYNIIYLRNFLSLFPLLAIFSARGLFASEAWLLNLPTIHSSLRLRLFIQGAFFGFIVVATLINAHWLWVASNSIIDAQPTQSFRMSCGETYRWKHPLLSSCNAYPNKKFVDKQLAELVDHITKNTQQTFVFSDMVRIVFSERQLSVPPNVSDRYIVDGFAVYYSREPFKEPDKVHRSTVGANRFNHYQLLPSGPYDVNFSYYPTWPGPNRIVIAPLKETFTEAGSIFSLKD